jgi:hypothetical protein
MNILQINKAKREGTYRMRITARCPPKARKRTTRRRRLMMSDFVWVAVAAMVAAFATIMGACVVGAYMMWEEFRGR